MWDVAIIGGGVAGLSLGAALAPDVRVLVLEREDALGYHTSGRSAALYEPNYGSGPIRALSEASGPGFAASGTLSPRGVMLIARADEHAPFEADRAHMDLPEIAVSEAIDRIPILDPQVISRAAFSPRPQDIDTDLLLQQFRKTITAHGGTIETSADVTAIAPGWTITAGKTHHAKALVIAAGAWADPVAQMAGAKPLGLTPLRRSMARLAAPGGHDTRSWPMLFGPGETWYAKPDAGALLVSPAEEDATEPHDAWADDMTLAEGLARYEAHVTEPVTRPMATWAGLRTFAPDRALVIGPDAQVPGLFWQAGQGGYGFQTCFAAARLGADLILGRPPELDAATVAALSPARFA
ncbi:MAG: NAD(P)/FAD-dependent oxidoreductase [Shimia sp.]